MSKTLILPIQLLSKNGRDKLHFRARHALRKSYEDLTSLKYARRDPTPDCKQRVTVRRVMGPRERPFDEQNVGAGSAVELIDALKRLGYFKDDSEKFVEPVFTQTPSTTTLQGPCVVVTLETMEVA